MPNQPRNTIFVQIRLDGDDELPGKVVPLNMLPYLAAIVQAEIFSAQADRLIAEELDATILAAVGVAHPKPEISR